MKKFIFIIIGGFLIIGLISYLYQQNTKETLRVIITDKETIMIQNSDVVESKYLIFTRHVSDTNFIEVFENTDEVLYGKYTKSDFYAKLQIGHIYEITVTGKRIPALSIYRNIIEIKQIK